MARQMILILILFATMSYAVFTYWPLLAPLVPFGRKAGPAVSVPAAAPTAVPSSEAPVKKITELDEIFTPSVEVKMIDPFALRIEVKTRAEVPLPVISPSGPDKEHPVVKPVEPKLEGIWIDAERRVAFISGQALSVGGTVLGWKVTSITRENVILQKGSATKTLKVEGR